MDGFEPRPLVQKQLLYRSTNWAISQVWAKFLGIHTRNVLNFSTTKRPFVMLGRESSLFRRCRFLLNWKCLFCFFRHFALKRQVVVVVEASSAAAASCSFDLPQDFVHQSFGYNNNNNSSEWAPNEILLSLNLLTFNFSFCFILRSCCRAQNVT